MLMKEMPSRDQKEKVLRMCITCLLVIVPAHHLGEMQELFIVDQRNQVYRGNHPIHLRLPREVEVVVVGKWAQFQLETPSLLLFSQLVTMEKNSCTLQHKLSRLI